MASCNSVTADHTQDSEAAAEAEEDSGKLDSSVEIIDGDGDDDAETEPQAATKPESKPSVEAEPMDIVDENATTQKDLIEIVQDAPLVKTPVERKRRGRRYRRRKLLSTSRSRNNNCHSPKAKMAKLAGDAEINGSVVTNTSNGDASNEKESKETCNSKRDNGVQQVKQRLSVRLSSTNSDKKPAVVEMRETRSKTKASEEARIKKTEPPKKIVENKPQTIIVTETKSLAQVINNAVRKEGGVAHEGGKPTLVIIETKSPTEVISLSKSSGSVTNTITVETGTGKNSSTTTLTPVSVSSISSITHSNHVGRNVTVSTASTLSQQLTPAVIEDGGMAVEVPSLVVPYLIEYPPSRTISEFLKMLPLDPKEIRELEEASKKKSLLAAASATSMTPSTSASAYYAGVGRPKTADRWGAYFESSLGKFFVDIGLNLAKEWVQADLVKSQQRKAEKEGRSSRDRTVEVLLKGLNDTKEKNEPYHFQLMKCVHCNFKTESIHVMNHHYDFPHERHMDFRCNFCTFKTRIVKDIVFHMEAEHGVHAKIERPQCFFQCPMCDFEDNSRAKVSKHTFKCIKKFAPDRNLMPPTEFDPPAKRPKVYPIIPPGVSMLPSTTTTKLGTTTITQIPSSKSKITIKPKDLKLSIAPGQGAYRTLNSLTNSVGNVYYRSGNMVYSQTNRSGSQSQVFVPSSGQPVLQYQSNQIYQVLNSSGQLMPVVGGNFGQLNNQRFTILPTATSNNSSLHGGPTPVALVPNIATAGAPRSVLVGGSSQRLQPPKPNISITPVTSTGKASILQPRTRLPTPSASLAKLGVQNESSFVVCEICDGYIKDLEQLRTHMQWIHKVKIHPKMIFNRPPLNCQKCQFRFFTDQGLERHLLGAHGLVTSSMQENANKGQDSGRCTICGKVFQWKLLAHMSKDHNMSLKPAHLSYKCTVCAATFGMYKLFETHVYQAHSTVAKRVLDAPDDKKGKKTTTSYPTGALPEVKDALPPNLVELKSSGRGLSFGARVGDGRRQRMKENEHLKPMQVKLCRVDKCAKCLTNSGSVLPLSMLTTVGADDVESVSTDNSVVSDAESTGGGKTTAVDSGAVVRSPTPVSKKSVVEKSIKRANDEDDDDDDGYDDNGGAKAQRNNAGLDLDVDKTATGVSGDDDDEVIDEDEEETALDMEVESHDVEHPSPDSIHTEDEEDEELMDEEEEHVTPVF